MRQLYDALQMTHTFLSFALTSSAHHGRSFAECSLPIGMYFFTATLLLEIFSLRMLPIEAGILQAYLTGMTAKWCSSKLHVYGPVGSWRRQVKPGRASA